MSVVGDGILKSEEAAEVFAWSSRFPGCRFCDISEASRNWTEAAIMTVRDANNILKVCAG